MVLVPHAPIRVLIASRSPAWSAGIASFLPTPPFRVDIAPTMAGALAGLSVGDHDLVVIDRVLADAPGAELAAAVRGRHPSARMILVLDEESAQARAQAIADGAAGCLLLTSRREGVLDALVEGLEGDERTRSDALRPLVERVRRDEAADALLTDQERVVLRLMRQHLTYKEIAQRLGVSWHTVRTHAQSILRKRGVHSRRDLEQIAPWITDAIGTPEHEAIV